MPPKRRITYIDTEKKELLKFESNELRTIGDFVALREIPTQSELNYLRSEYFHKAMILLESFLSNKDKIMNVVKAKELSSMWKWYYTWKRNETKDIEHRLIFFALRSRLDFLINIKNNNENDINTANELEINDKKQDELKHFLKVGSIETLIIDSTVSSFWRMFNLITNKFYCLRYNAIFERHYERLYLCYGRLISLRLRKDPKRIFADPIYCTYDKSSGYRFTNKYFMETCEPIFNDIQRTFEIYKIMLNGTIHLNHDLGLQTNNNNEIQYPVEKRKQFLSWLFEQIQGNFLEPSENEVQRYIYKLHLNPGEEERFRLEDRHSDPTPYNMISKYRRQHFDELADIFEKEQPLHDLVQRYMDIFNSLLPIVVVVPTAAKTVIVPEDKMELEEEGDKPMNNIFDNLYGEKSQHSQMFPEDIPSVAATATATTTTATTPDVKFQWKSEIDLIAMCLPMLTFAYAKNYPGALDFVETFVITQERIQSIIKRKISQKNKQYLDRKTIQQIVLSEIYNFRIISNTQEVPIFVQLFNEMFILEDGFILPGNNSDYVLPRFTRCTDFISCYLHWMKLCCENQKINGLPCKSTVESLNLTDQYTLFFPENKEVISRLNSLHNKKQHEIQTNLGLPDNYNKQ